MGSIAAPPPPLIRSLQAGVGYPHPVGPVRLVETHISWVLLTGDRAYKIKKPVAPGFLDFSTLERRRAACHEELRLNRRLAPDLYLGVVPVTGTPEEPRLGGPGPPIEYAVQMRQFPAGALLTEVLGRGELEPDEIAAFAVRLSAFHESLVPADPGSGWGTASAIEQPLRQTLDQLGELLAADSGGSGLIATAGKHLTSLLAKGSPLIEARRQAGRVRECHGDLHLGNLVGLEAGITAFDALEFDPALRWIDVLNEVAFLTMDLLVRDQAPLAWTFLNAYLQAGGDYDGLPLLELYLGYRALVRAKVALLPGAAAHSQPEVNRLLEFAARPLGARRPLLVLMCGVSGSGKSWLARRLAPLLGAIHLRSDLERKRLVGIPALGQSGSALDAGIYTAPATAATYGRLRDLARIALNVGYPVIIDATHLTRAEREPALALARAAAVPAIVVYCHGETDLLETRLTARRRYGSDPSEADPTVLAAQLLRLAPPAESEADCLLTVAANDADPIERLLGGLQSYGYIAPGH